MHEQDRDAHTATHNKLYHSTFHLTSLNLPPRSLPTHIANSDCDIDVIVCQSGAHYQLSLMALYLAPISMVASLGGAISRESTAITTPLLRLPHLYTTQI